MTRQRRLQGWPALPTAAILALLVLVMATGCTETAQSSATRDARLAEPEPAPPPLGDQPPTPKTLLSMADILAAQGKDKECEFVLSSCVRQHPGFAPAYNSLAELLMRQARVAEAENLLKAALQRWPDDPVLLNNLGMCLLVRRDFDAALDYFTRAAARAPKTDKYRANMATCLGMLGRDAEALALLKQILPEQEAVQNAEVLRRAYQKASQASAP